MTTLNTKVLGVWTPIAGDVNASNPINDFITYWTPSPWTNAALVNGWSNFPGYQSAQYRKRGDMVDMRGVIQSGASSTVAFVLPVGFRPPTGCQMIIRGGAGDCYCDIGANGDIIFSYDGSVVSFILSFSTI